MIIRQQYLDKITPLLGKHIIKVLVGQRRVGKTTLLKQLVQYIGEPSCVFLSLDNLELGIETQDQLMEYITNNLTGAITTLVVDEVQMVPGWEKVINTLYSTREHLDVIITGSNSTMFSSQLATLLAGRYMMIHIFGFSYAEYQLYTQSLSSKDSFYQYLLAGTTPSLYQFTDTESKKQRCESLIDTIIVKDISAKRNIRDIALLRTLILYVINNNANLTSITSIVEGLTKQGYTTNIETIGSYIEYIKAVFLFYETERYDLQGKQILQRQKKFYLNDPAMRFHVFGGFDIGLTKTLENIVFLEGRIAGRSMKVGTIKQKEVDFIAEKSGKTIYIQVAYQLNSPEVIEREYTSLETIQDARPKYVVSFDEGPFQSRNGIIHVPVRSLVQIFGQ